MAAIVDKHPVSFARKPVRRKPVNHRPPFLRLIVSQGTETASVPDVTGSTEKEAMQALKKANFKVAITREFSADVDKGLVVDQTPKGLTSLAVGGTVNLVISKGPDLVVVPKLVGLTEAEAKKELEKAGLKAGQAKKRTTTGTTPGIILEQSVAAGKKLDRGSAVDYFVAAAPTTIAMPNLIGLTAEQARDKLAPLGFADPTSTTEASTKPIGEVVGQDPQPGDQIDPTKQVVTIFVSDGPGTSTVP